MLFTTIPPGVDSKSIGCSSFLKIFFRPVSRGPPWKRETCFCTGSKAGFPSAPQRRRKRLPDQKSWSKPPFGKSGNPLFRQPYPQIFHPEFCHWAGGCGQKVGGEAAHCCGEHQLYRQPWYEVERQQPVHHAHSSSDVSLLPATDASLGGTAESASGQFQEFPWALKMGANPERKISSAVVIPQCLLPQGKNRGQAPERRST